MNIPTSAISLGKDDVVVHVEAKDTKQVLEDIQVSEDMKPVGGCTADGHLHKRQ